VRAVTDASFEREVLRSPRPVVVDFWAPWCGPCKAVEPILTALAAEHDEVEFVRMDVDANPLTAARYGVLSLPTATLFAGGAAAAPVPGARRRPDYERAWADWLQPAEEGGEA
jgi:thioredoxin 1